MKIRDLLKAAIDRLRARNIASATLDAELLLAHALGIERFKLFTTSPILTQVTRDKFDEYITRREQFEPVAQILETKEFWGLDFKVSNAVLIPRPETELIIELSCKYFPKKEGNLSILDLGTGSGCIVISLLKEFKRAKASAVDISPKALELATENAERHQVASRLELLQGSWFTPLPAQAFDLIVSNPPYIGADEPLDAEVVNYEPHIALFAEDNGLAAYGQIAARLGDFMHSGSFVILEVGAQQADTVAKILEDNNIEVVEIARDLAGHKRALVCKAINPVSFKDFLLNSKVSFEGLDLSRDRSTMRNS